MAATVRPRNGVEAVALMGRSARPPAVAFVRHSVEYPLDLRREVDALTAQGIRCDVLCLAEPGKPRPQTTDGVTLWRLPGTKTRGGRVRYLLEYGWFVAAAAVVLGVLHVRHRYRAVQVNTMPDFAVFSAAIPKLLGVPVVVFMQEPTPELAATLGAGRRTVRALEAAERVALRFADHAITVTDQLRERYVERGADPRRISVVLNGPNPDDLLPASEPRARRRCVPGRLVALCHGTIEDRYGQDTIVDAVAIAARQLPDLQVIITGRGSAEATMIDRIAAARLGDQLRFEGWVTTERLAQLLRTADVGIVAQKASPYSHLVHTNKMYDYWIAGLAVIASRLDATASDFGDDTIAYFEPGDAEDLARRLVDLATSPERRSELTAAGRRAYERVGWPVQKERYLDVYRQLVPGLVDEEGESA